MSSNKVSNKVAEVVEAWLRETVIGLNLCPFAKQPYNEGGVKITVASSAEEQGVFDELLSEFLTILSAKRSELETSIFVMPNILHDFDRYLEFLNIAEMAIERLGYQGLIQLASFHPDYVFQDVEEGDYSNFTNRAPYPIIHIIREESLTEVNKDEEAMERIPQRNIELMRQMCSSEIRKHFPWKFQ